MIPEENNSHRQKAAQGAKRTAPLAETEGKPLTRSSSGAQEYENKAHKAGKYALLQTEEPEEPKNGTTPAAVKPEEPKAEEPKAEEAKPSKPKSNPLKRMLILGAVAAVLVAGLIYGYSYYQYSRNHVSTDDASVSGNLVNISPLISGTLSRLTVQEGDPVKAGQLIARLDNSGQQASSAGSIHL